MGDLRTDQDRAGCSKSAHNRGIFLRDVMSEHPRATRRRNPRNLDDLLRREGHAVQWARRLSGIGRLGRNSGTIGVDVNVRVNGFFSCA